MILYPKYYFWKLYVVVLSISAKGFYDFIVQYFSFWKAIERWHCCKSRIWKQNKSSQSSVFYDTFCSKAAPVYSKEGETREKLLSIYLQIALIVHTVDLQI